jgi:TPR repeat protein
MICWFTRRVDTVANTSSAKASRGSGMKPLLPATLRVVTAILVLIAFCSTQMRPAHANALTRATAAYARGDYVAVVSVLTPLALRGDAKAQAFLGFMYENGFGAPQAYDAAADLYVQAAIRGNPFAQSMLGLMYDKGHGVPQDFILAYKWLNLAAAHAPKHERDYYLRLRNAVASKMSPDQIVVGQRLALLWAPGRP